MNEMPTSRLQLPLLASGQAQKEVSHNEALIALDAVVHASTSTGQFNQPPASPAIGATYICGPSPEAAWSGHPNSLAYWSVGGWRFIAPFEGLQVTDAPSGETWRFLSGEWRRGVIAASEVRIGGLKIIGNRTGPILKPAGGSTVDTEARVAIDQIVMALRAHGLIES